jgi:hypothetical protein
MKDRFFKRTPPGFPEAPLILEGVPKTEVLEQLQSNDTSVYP